MHTNQTELCGYVTCIFIFSSILVLSTTKHKTFYFLLLFFSNVICKLHDTRNDFKWLMCQSQNNFIHFNIVSIINPRFYLQEKDYIKDEPKPYVQIYKPHFCCWYSCISWESWRNRFNFFAAAEMLLQPGEEGEQEIVIKCWKRVSTFYLIINNSYIQFICLKNKYK